MLNFPHLDCKFHRQRALNLHCKMLLKPFAIQALKVTKKHTIQKSKYLPLYTKLIGTVKWLQKTIPATTSDVFSAQDRLLFSKLFIVKRELSQILE